MVELLVYDRWGAQIGTVTPITCTRAEEVNGEDTLTFTTPVRFEKGDRVVFQDGGGVWHEHVVTETDESREEARVLNTVIAENSLCETNGDYVEDLRNQNMAASAALAKALSVTRWEQGATSSLGSKSQNFYHMSARAAINAVAETWGGEVRTEISVGTAGVSRRRVSVVSRIGGNGYKRFEYKKDLISIRRKVESDDVVTALYGYGSGLAATDESGEETGGFTRKITFGEVNGGMNYVADNEALLLWGRPDGTLLPGGLAHVFGEVEYDECEDPSELLALTKAELPNRTKPKVTYEATVQALCEAGFRFEGFSLGDDVQIIDWAFSPALELQGRILRVEWNYRVPSETVITLGNVTPAISDQINRHAAALQSMRDHSGAWDKAASADESYISGVIGVINAVMNATGGYVYMEPGEGITVYDRPVDQNPTMAIQLNGAGFRIANRRVGDTWQWRTFGTGDGFSADEINAGIIQGGSNWWNLETGDMLFKQGGIRDSKGKNFWDLDTGEFSLSADAKIGDKTAAKIAQDAVDAQTQRSIFNKLTNDGQTQGIYLSGGKLYINATYLKTGIISDVYGRNSWNLGSGTLTTNYMKASNIDASGTFECGTSSNLLRLINGEIQGIENGVQIGVVDFSAHMRNVSTGQLTTGLQLTGNNHIRITTPLISAAASSSESTTTTHAVTKNCTLHYISKIDPNSDGTITWWNATRNINFVDGFCTVCNFD